MNTHIKIKNKIISKLFDKNNLFIGNAYLQIENAAPYYVTGSKNGHKDMLIKQLFHFGKLYFSIRCDNCGAFKNDIVIKLCNVFDKVDGLKAIKNNRTYYLEDCLWVVKNIDNLQVTGNASVFFDKKNLAYIGFSHRSACSFKIGDTLFEENIKNLTEFYKDKKLRRKFLKYLLKYHFKNDAFMFGGMVKSGISDVIPFKKHGIIQIKTFEEAYQAAINFADYVS